MRSLRVVLLTMMIATVLTSCGSGTAPGPSAAGVEVAPLHIHGLGINPADGALFVATHDGLYRAPATERELARVGDSRRDTMGFAVVGPDRFLASGHPALDEPGPVLQGLIRSHDAGDTWTRGPLSGSADLHVIRPGRRVFYAHDAHENRLFRGPLHGSGLQLRRTPRGTTIDLAVDPADDNRVFAATDHGLFVSSDGARRWSQASRRRTGLMTYADGRLFMIAANGVVSVLRRFGGRWSDVGTLPDAPAALATGPNGELIAATADGAIHVSTNSGRDWRRRIGATRPATNS